MHNPFLDKERFAYILTKESGADECVSNGDIDDLYPLSRFVKYKDINAVETIKELDWYFHTIAQHFAKNKLVLGNHDKRVWKYFEQKGVPIDIIEAWVNFGYMESLASKYKNINIVKTQVAPPNLGELYHFYILGKDCVVGHWETYSKVNLRAAENAFLWYHQWQSTLGLPEIKLLLQAHTHALGMRDVWGNKRYGETGCICQVQEYTVDGRTGYTPLQSGYWIVIQKNGETDLKESRYITLT